MARLKLKLKLKNKSKRKSHCTRGVCKTDFLLTVCRQLLLLMLLTCVNLCCHSTVCFNRIFSDCGENESVPKRSAPYWSIPLPSARQHPSYGDCLEVKREYYQNSSVLDCVTQCSQSAAHLCEQFLQVQQIGFVTLGSLHCA